MSTYMVIGQNGSKFGPADEAALSAWAREGRIHASTQLQCTASGQIIVAQWLPAVQQSLGLAPPAVQQLIHSSTAAQTANSNANHRAMLMFEANKKSPTTALLLCWFLGVFGAHRFYAGRSGSAAAMLIITLVSFMLMVVLLGFLTIWITVIWAFVDLFLVSGMIRDYNMRMASHFSQ